MINNDSSNEYDPYLALSSILKGKVLDLIAIMLMIYDKRWDLVPEHLDFFIGYSTLLVVPIIMYLPASIISLGVLLLITSLSYEFDVPSSLYYRHLIDNAHTVFFKIKETILDWISFISKFPSYFSYSKKTNTPIHRAPFETLPTPLKMHICEFFDDVKDPLRLHSISKVFASDFKITGTLDLSRYRYTITPSINTSLKNMIYYYFSTYHRLTAYKIILGDQNIKTLSKKLTNISNLNLSRCQITDDRLFALAENLKGLTSLNLYNCCISDQGLIVLAENLKGLTSLNLKWCQKITDQGLMVLAPYLGNLTSLNLGECNQITDQGLITLAQNLKGLTSLNLSGWFVKFTDEGVIALAQNSKGLTSLNLSGCEKITDDGLKVVVNSCPNLNKLINTFGINCSDRLRFEIATEQETQGYPSTALVILP